ncbi:putative bifunctional diguanylate cyclase/phosphodiesterase [Actinoplanes italicus]|uniref:Diguanylate cyclase (GGDEF)-like protein n=1 Tax=Actinoplanes italicus TaxID=113567 RepID=A0A2T0KHX1_9ACTN|nr:EAL domain-containing protein [Actinoplanes italicus]PRX23025.1 diguanylate cyclase (GGDEF)-like protein [Actinoplanes italicus]
MRDRNGRRWWSRLLEARATGRSAIAGTALGIVTLAVSAVLASTGTVDATAEVRRVQTITQKLNGISVKIHAEDAALREYLATGGTDYRGTQLKATLGSARADLDWLQESNAVDRAELDSIRGGYENYIRIVLDIMSGTEHGSDVTGYADLASLTFAPLRDNVLDLGDDHQQQLADYLGEVNREADLLNAVAETTIGVVLTLFAVCATVLVGYQRRAERQAAQRLHEATHDPLTGLGNRAKLQDELDSAVRHARHTGEPFSLLLIDLDRFKEVNDTLGHHAGDELLVEVAQRLSQGCRTDDVVVRLGGDEFALILPTAPDHPEALEAGHRILEELRRPIELSDLLVDIDASIGVASYPRDGDDAALLLQHADVAMYTAKRRHGGVSGYDPSMDHSDTDRLTLQSELRRGIERGELVVLYQPKVDVTTRLPCGAEALVRWQHPARGLLSPDVFIPLAEDSGLIDLVTVEVLDQALAQIRRWEDLGHELPVSVNIPARSLTDATFPGVVDAALVQHGVRPGLLTLEITESAMIADLLRAGETLNELRKLGVKISIDDFGTGYSSIAHLRDMPPHELKIDRSFVMKMSENSRDESIVRAVVDLAKNLRLRVVAEGVETESALRTLGDLGCHEAQGYHISRPVPAAELTDWLSKSDIAISAA